MTRTAAEQHAAEIQKLNELLAVGAVDLATYSRAMEDAHDRALRSSQAWADGARIGRTRGYNLVLSELLPAAEAGLVEALCSDRVRDDAP